MYRVVNNNNNNNIFALFKQLKTVSPSQFYVTALLHNLQSKKIADHELIENLKTRK